MTIMRNIGAGVVILIGLVAIVGLTLALPDPAPRAQVYGVTFSKPHAEGIGLDWRETYNAILEELGVKRLRLNAYWDEIEPEDGIFDFDDLDYQMDRAARSGAQVILSVGRKLPRWPECHEPSWVQGRREVEKQAEILEMLGVVVSRYEKHPALRMWQLENEPLLDFGICPPEDRAFLLQEQKRVRARDLHHPILITDSGELNSWLPAAAYGDVLGTTMYRTVFSDTTQKLFRYDYIFPSWMYRIKARVVWLVRGKPVIISELQGEPWGALPFPYMSKDERRASFSPERFAKVRGFAQRTQLPEAYWWGVEYWYWEKEIQGDPTYWEYAKSIFRGI